MCHYIFSGEKEYVFNSRHTSYILSVLPLILNYRRKNVIRLEGVGYVSNKGLSSSKTLVRMSDMLRFGGT